jgi:hypothetical protein
MPMQKANPSPARRNNTSFYTFTKTNVIQSKVLILDTSYLIQKT